MTPMKCQIKFSDPDALVKYDASHYEVLPENQTLRLSCQKCNNVAQYISVVYIYAPTELGRTARNNGKIIDALKYFMK